MIRCIPGPKAEELGMALYRLMRPTSAPDDLAEGWSSCVDDKNGQKWVMMDDAAALYIFPTADFSTVRNLLTPHVSAGNITAQELLTLEDQVMSHRGTQLQVWTALPEFFKNQAKTWDSMIEAGLLAQPGNPT